MAKKRYDYKYDHSPAGRARRIRHAHTPAGRRSRAKYEHSQKGKARRRRWLRKPEVREYTRFYRRSLNRATRIRENRI